MKAKTTFQRHGKAVAALLSAVLCCFLIGGCKRDVHYEIDHELRAIELDRTSQTLAVRYDILERQVWQQWPCFSHGCGDSKRLPSQSYDLFWNLPVEGAEALIPHAKFGTHVRAGSRSYRLDVASALVYGDARVRFVEEDRIGRLPVHMYDSLLCWRALPCYVKAPDTRHMLIVNKIYSLDTGQPVIDLSANKNFGAFVERTVEQYSYVLDELPDRSASIGYALSNDLRHIVSHPKEVGCPRSREARQRFSAVLVFDLEKQTFDTHAVPLTDEDRHPYGQMQHVYVLDDAVHFVSHYADGFETDKGPSCRSAERLLDFDVSSGLARPRDADAYLIGSGTSVDGAANFQTDFAFKDGVIEIVVFDIPRNARRTYHLALPDEILAQVSPDKVRPGIAPGEFIRRQGYRVKRAVRTR